MKGITVLQVVGDAPVDNVHVKINEKERTAILNVGNWETFVQYDKAREITTNSAAVAMLRRIDGI